MNQAEAPKKILLSNPRIAEGLITLLAATIKFVAKKASDASEAFFY